MICLVNSVNERDLSLLTSAVDLAANVFLWFLVCKRGEEIRLFLSFVAWCSGAGLVCRTRLCLFFLGARKGLQGGRAWLTS